MREISYVNKESLFLSAHQKVELARQMCTSDSPLNKTQLARTLGIARNSLYIHPKRPKMDKELALRIEELHERDDTMGHRKLAVMLATGKNRVKRVMHKYGIAARRKRKKYIYPGKASQVAPNLLRLPEQVQGKEEVSYRTLNPSANRPRSKSEQFQNPNKLVEKPKTL